MALLNPQNIYHMLAYVYRSLEMDIYRDLSSESFENIYELLAEILQLGINSQIKRGLGHDYEDLSDELKTVRGKINFRESMACVSGYGNQITCEFDEYTINTPMNRVLKTTLHYLLHSGYLSHVSRINKGQISLSKKLQMLMRYFSEVPLVDPNSIRWDMFRYHRNNATYKMLMNICYYVLSGLLPSKEKGKYKLPDFTLNQRAMSVLYENFIRAFYERKCFDKKYFDKKIKVEKKQIKWDIDPYLKVPLLPKMEADIILTYNNNALIIDAKYYSKALSLSRFGDVKKYSSANLYQIYTYVNNYDSKRNLEHLGNVSGMLLYAKTDETDFIECDYLKIGTHYFSIKTLDLSLEWKKIEEQLMAIANTFMAKSNCVCQ